MLGEMVVNCHVILRAEHALIQLKSYCFALL